MVEIATKLAIGFAPTIICALVILKKIHRSENSDFYNWRQETKPYHNPTTYIWSEYYKKSAGDRSDSSRRMRESILSDIAAGRHLVINIDEDTGGEFSLDVDGEQFDKCKIANLTIGNTKSRTLLRNLKIWKLALNPGESGKQVRIDHCFIESLVIGAARPENHSYISLSNSWIGSLSLTRARVQVFEIQGGGILNIHCPVAGSHGTNPFLGPVTFRGVYLPRRTTNGLIRDAQPLRNLRAHLMDLGNIQAASVAHSAELALDRETETSRWVRLFSFMYEFISDFGASAARPLGLLFALAFSTFLFALIFGDIQPQLPSVEYKGWQRLLLGSSSGIGDLARAALIAVQSIINPLGILGAKALVVAGNGFMAAWIFLQSILSPILLAMFFFALRRRFKMSA